jgi:cysteine desulfurase
MKIVYLDNAATTLAYNEVVKVMGVVMLENYGNPSSSHKLGEDAKEIMNASRIILAREINAKTEEIIFTSGATEASNMAIFGLAHANKNRKKIIISAIEHDATYMPCMKLKEKGYEIVEVPVGSDGLIDIERLEKEIDSNTLLVSIIHGHNELGVVQDIFRIGQICKKKKIAFHVDAVQTFGKLKIDVHKMNISLLSASGHKIGASKGIGFLFVKEGVEIEPIFYGGGQENERRSGTENVPAIAGFAKALEIVKKADKEKIKNLRDYFIDKLQGLNGKINGNLKERLYNNISVSFSGKNAEMLVSYLSEKGIMCSTRSACSSKQKEENRILKAIGLNENEIKGTIRFALNEFVTKKDVDFVLNEIEKGLVLC